MSPSQRIKQFARSYRIDLPEFAIPEETQFGGVALRGLRSNAVYLVRQSKTGLRQAISHVSACEARA
ncbi:hypothetical protein RBWH47_01294 [Rhodopirellula baltica WH47]|uniref:Uncharacterized protein n=1 Tax=Rhodopirellula baltica WH47 TaxID=991778 RepID=F2AQ15_RHOBT|nr:hypothetical protein RBWH47_01294 [Rhodopirellula baltica WH47]